MSQACANCGEPLAGDYCAHCGQRVESLRKPVHTLLGEAVSEFLSLDGRLLRTLRAILSPGRLTVAFLAGRRKSYVTPVRLYVVSSLFFFLTASFTSMDASNRDVYVDGELLGDREASPDRPDMQLSTANNSSALGQVLENSFEEKSMRWREMEPQELLDHLSAGLERSLPYGLILFVPFLAMALKLLYVRNRNALYYDHLIFALHFQSLLFLAFIAARGLNEIGLERLSPVLPYLTIILLVVPVYMGRALKRVYRQSWLWTAGKTAMLLIVYVLIMGIVIATTMMVVLWRI